ncbi:MAG: hypothetical protein LC723_14810, partial [Actinobacteria bacterium]|nr:hypothetical protein [Actinomycetota bacterium]
RNKAQYLNIAMSGTGRGARIGEAHHRAVLTAKQVLEIRRKHSEGVTYFSLFEEYPIQSMGTLSAIISRRTWKHI